jgi:hypothetical protein
VYWDNAKYIGDMFPDVDGFYYFWPIKEGGSWSEYSLRLLADKLKELNKEWKEIIQNDSAI